MIELVPLVMVILAGGRDIVPSMEHIYPLPITCGVAIAFQ